MVNLSDLSTAGSSSDSSGGTSKINLGYGATGNVAHYVMQTRNTSTAGYGFVFFDQDFGTVAWGGNSYTNQTYQTVSHWQNWQSSTYTAESNIWNGYQGSQSQVSSGSGRYLNSLQHSQWGGAPNVRSYSTGSIGSRLDNDSSNITTEMKAVFNSDHTNRAIAYQFQNGKIKALQYDGFGSPNNSLPYPNTQEWSVPSANSAMDGTASYNKSLKKLFVIRSWNSATEAIYNCYSNVDFDKYPSPYEAMEDSSVTVVTGTMTTSSANGSNEAMYRMVPVLCDDGTVWCVTMHPHSGLLLWGRTAVPTSDGNFSATFIGQLNLTTRYGVESAGYYGRTMMETRDRTGVCVAAPYYYYGSGCMAFCLPKSGSSTNHAYTTVSETSSSAGWQPMPWRDDGFCFYFAGNGYANNYNGSFVSYFMSPSASTSAGGFSTSGNNSNARIYLPYWGLPNTTNYPGMSKVTDYDHLKYNNGVR